MQEIAPLINSEISDFLNLKPDCLILCNVWLHKFFDMMTPPLSLNIRFFHAVEVIERQALQLEYQDILLIGTKHTMEDGFFEKRLRAIGLTLTTPNLAERDEIQRIQTELAQRKCDLSYKTSLQGMLNSYTHLDAVVLDCTELPLIIQENDSPLTILDPLALQCRDAITFALD
ncbi:MAG: aspartate/glutamate racemase family protein [Alphaproteobacteria bacterium]|nr:aspartate/glutamate racemase family protein [Alphaproteobacteria bacterium]